MIDATTTDEQLGELFAAARTALEENRQYAVVVKRGTFEKEAEFVWSNGYELVREQALKILIKKVYQESFLISTTGKISRELYEQCDALYGNHDRLFMTVGGMGHAPMIAFLSALYVLTVTGQC